MLDDKLKALWARISPPQKAAFFGCFLSGYLVHLYVFTTSSPTPTVSAASSTPSR